MVGSLGGAGLAVSVREVIAPLTHGRFVWLTVLVGWLVCPALAYLLVHVIPLDRPYGNGLLVLSLAPCAPFAPAMVQKARGDAGALAAFMLLTAAATVVVMPLAVPLMSPGVTADAAAIVRRLLAFVLGPLLLGMAVRAAAPGAATWATAPVAAITNGVGLIALVLIGVLYGRGVINAIGSYAIATAVLFVAVSTVVAYLTGTALPRGERIVLTIGMCTRNLGAALAPISVIEPDPRAIVMIAIAAPVTVIMSALLARWLASDVTHVRRDRIPPRRVRA